MPPTSKERLSRDAWLQRAMEILSAEGDAKIRIDSICRDLGVTKGSFYWHFENREDFLKSIVEFWHENYNKIVPQLVELDGGSPTEKLFRLFEVVTSRGLSHYDEAFDSWAAHEPYVSDMVREAYEMRFDYVSGLFKELGFRSVEMETRTCAFLGFLMTEWRIRGRENSKRSRSRIQKELEFFVRP